MTVFIHELKRGKLSLLIWTSAIAFMLMITVLIYPQMKPQMAQMENMMADMGSFSAAFGMDKMSFGEFSDYFAIECGNVLGLGGAVFAAITGASMLAKEEKEHTAEFLYTHPVSRTRIVTEKLLALVVQITILILAVAAVSAVSIALIGESTDTFLLFLIFLAYLLLSLEIAMLCFGISAFLRSGLGVALGLAIGLYFLNILSNITEDVKFLKYITPFSYTEVSDILQNRSIPPTYLAIGMCMAAAAVTAAFLKTHKKDISA